MATTPNPPGAEAQEYELNEILRDIAIADEQSRPRLPENIFVEVFLPFFAGTGNPHNATVDLWNTISNGPFNSVDIVNPTGEVLFVVPALHDRDAISPATKSLGENSVQNMITTAEQMKRISPMDADRYLSHGLSNMLDKLQGKHHVIANLKEWNKIFTRYGLPALLQALGQPEENKAAEEKPNDHKPIAEEDWDPL